MISTLCIYLITLSLRSHGQPVRIFPQTGSLESVSCVDLLVAFEVLAPAEALPTLETAVGLLSGVNAFVLLQVSCLAEGAATHQAAVRLLPSVTPLMDPEVPDAAEGLPANLTGVMLLVVRAMTLTRPGESM